MFNSPLPVTSAKRLCIICEGDEEYEYLQRLQEIGAFNPKFSISLINAEGNGNIAARYQDAYQNDLFDLVLIFCDTDSKPYEQYNEIKDKINKFHGRKNAAEKVVIFGNPCTMQIVILHWALVKLKSPSKSVNASIIEKYTGVKKYRGSSIQRKKIYSKIDIQNFNDMLKRIDKISRIDTEKTALILDR